MRFLGFLAENDIPMSDYDFDVVVIGGGSGGYAAARSTAAAGLRTAVIEGGEEVGGLCILRGCMPTKSLLFAAEVRHLSKHAPTWGIYNESSTFDFSEVMARKNAMIEDFASYRREQLADGRFTFIRAMARFEDAHTLALSNGDKVTAGYFVVSTGSVVSPSPIPALDEVGYITSDHVMTMTELPKSLIVLGGGAVAVEIAQFFQRFDVEVTLIQRSDQILKGLDRDGAEVVTEALRQDGMTVYTGTKLTGAAKTEDGKSVTFEHDGDEITVEADEILFALGRSPNTCSLGLEEIGVKLRRSGHIETNPGQQTTVPNIYAAGDCAGPHEIVHIAIQQGEIAAHNIVGKGKPKEIDYRLLTQVVFTHPQAATVGLTEKDAKEQGIEYLVADYPFNDHGKSLIMEEKLGFVKLLCNPESGELIGGACIGPHGGELIHEITAAMCKRMTARELAEMPHYHPTLAEIWTYPAEDLADEVDERKA